MPFGNYSHQERVLAIQSEFDQVRRHGNCIDVPLSLWMPDEQAATFAWLGRLHRWVVGMRTVRMERGVLPGRMQGRVPGSPRQCRQDAHRWARAFPYAPPSEMRKSLLLDMDPPIRIAFGKHRFDMTVVVPGDDDSVLALVRRRFKYLQWTVEHSWLRVVKQRQSQGVGTRLLAAFLPLYIQLRIIRIELTAGLSAGGSVWPRFGFVPAEKDWRRVRQTVLKNCDLITQHLKRSGGPAQPDHRIFAQLNAARNLAVRDDPKSLWVIRDMTLPLEYAGRTATVGAHLLRGTRWHGSLDLRDAEAVTRFRDQLKRVGLDVSNLETLVQQAQSGRSILTGWS